jgi:hypothetical protein
MANINKNQKILLQWSAGGEKKDPNAIIIMVVLFLLMCAALIYNLILKDWMVGAVFTVIIIILIWYFFGSSKAVNIVIGDQGIQLNNTFYNFENIKGYWFSEKSDTFYLEPKKKGNMIISFPLGSKKFEEVKAKLPDYLTEVEGRGEDIMDRITHFLRM